MPSKSDKLWARSWGWEPKAKGCARIYTHPALDRAVVENFKGIFYCGKSFNRLDEAFKYAMKTHQTNIEEVRKGKVNANVES